MAKVFGWSEDNVSLTALRDRQYQPSSGIDIPDRVNTTTVGTPGNGSMRLTFFTPTRTLTVSNFTVVSGNSAAADTGGTTVRKIGLFTVDTSAQTVTAVARSANDSALLTTNATVYTKAFTVEAGYSSSYTLIAGTTYAVGILLYNTGGTFGNANMIYGATSGIGAQTSLLPQMCALIGSKTDITSTALSYAGGATVAMPYVRLT